ncbi:MAG: hypothetical protein WD872_21140 [Pirellulaceae bacterium]
MNKHHERDVRKWSLARFSMRSLLMAMLIAAVLFAWFGWRYRRAQRQAPAVAVLRELGANVVYDFDGSHVVAVGRSKKVVANSSPYPAWLVDRLGIDFFHDVTKIHCESSRKLTDENVRRFWLAVGDLPDVVDLEASGGVTRPGCLAPLAGHRKLRTLALRWADLGTSDFEVLARLEGIEELNLSETPITDADLALIGRIEPLQRLDLHHTKITDAGMKELAGLPNLEQLWLSGTTIGDEGIALLRGHPKLWDLDLCHTKITDKSLVHVAAIPQLAELDLAMTTVTDRGLVHLEGHATLAYLNLESTAIAGEGLAHLKRLPNLRELCLGSRSRGTEISLAGLTRCRQLQRLKVNGQVNLSELAQLDLPRVIEVGFGGEMITEEMLLALAETDNIKAIYYDLFGIPPAAVQQFRQMQPQCELKMLTAPLHRGLRSRP